MPSASNRSAVVNFRTTCSGECRFLVAMIIEPSCPHRVSGDTVENYTVPVVATADVTVLDANGNPVPGAAVGSGNSTAGFSKVNVQQPDGSSIDYKLEPTLQGCTTDGTGTCSLPCLLGGNVPLLVEPPSGEVVRSGGSCATDPSDITVQLADYASVVSAGTESGNLTIATPAGTSLENVSDSEASANGLPSNAVELTGALNYVVTGLTPGATINVVLNLPPGSDPNQIYKYENGSYVNVTSIASISGNTVTLSITDGGLGDADGVANGTIVDPVVPVYLSGPHVSGSTPPRAARAVKYLPVVISGSGFKTSTAAKVTTSGTGVSFSSVKVVSSTQINANVTIAGTAATGLRNLVVTEGKAIETCTGCFTVDALPTLTKVTSATVARGTTSSITVDGSGFVSGASVSFSGSGVTGTVTTVTPGALALSVTVASNAKLGSYTLKLKNGDGGTASLAKAVKVTSSRSDSAMSIGCRLYAAQLGERGFNRSIAQQRRQRALRCLPTQRSVGTGS